MITDSCVTDSVLVSLYQVFTTLRIQSLQQTNYGNVEETVMLDFHDRVGGGRG